MPGRLNRVARLFLWSSNIFEISTMVSVCIADSFVSICWAEILTEFNTLPTLCKMLLATSALPA